MDKIEFFLNDNKSGWKTIKNKLIIKFPDLVSEIENYCNINNLIDVSFKEMIWFYINDMKIRPVCINCGKLLTFKRSLSEGYGTYCSIKCCNKHENRIENIKATNNKKYKGNAPACSIDVVNKIKNTCIKLYNVDNPMKINDVKLNLKLKCQQKHGVDYPAQSITNKNKIWLNKIINENDFVNANPSSIFFSISSTRTWPASRRSSSSPSSAASRRRRCTTASTSRSSTSPSPPSPSSSSDSSSKTFGQVCDKFGRSQPLLFLKQIVEHK